MTSIHNKRIGFEIASRVPLSIYTSISGQPLLLPYYHIISDEERLHVKHLYPYKTVREFRHDLDVLLRHYVPLELKDVLAHVREGRPLTERGFLLSFDDGYREISDVVAPILFEKGIPATFFVSSDFVDNRHLCYLNKISLIVERLIKEPSPSLGTQVCGVLRALGLETEDAKAGVLSVQYAKRDLLDEIADLLGMDFAGYSREHEPYLTTEQLHELLGQGFSVGAHSIDHPLYSTLTLEDQLRQTTESIRFVRETFGLDYGVFAFPHSDNDVSLEFFDKLSRSLMVDLTFGTAGIIDDTAPNNLQRFSLEKPFLAAERIIAYQHARRLLKFIKGRAIITRTPKA